MYLDEGMTSRPFTQTSNVNHRTVTIVILELDYSIARNL
jgi:hypothetical protein